LDDTKQQEFEADLSARDISLGEYMEIVEQAALEATARGVSRGAVSIDDQELLTIAASLPVHPGPA